MAIMTKPISLLASIAITAIAAVAGSVATRSAPQFYGALDKPSWAPPAWLFGPAWTILYLLMAVAAWLLWLRREQPLARRALVLYVAQLVLNAIWSWLFFRFHLGGLALLELSLLWVSILVLILLAARVRRAAAILLLPYILWVTYAGLLNGAVWRMNPHLL